MKPRNTAVLSISICCLVALAAAVTPAAAGVAGDPASQEAETPAEQAGEEDRSEEVEDLPTPRFEEEIVVTATRLPLKPSEIGSSVTVVTEREIEASGARWVSEVLEGVAGVAVARNGGPGAVTSVFLRGANSNHTLVLINGVKVNSPSTGGFNFANLPASQVERIEVLRGPQSTLYGSEAIGGVINVVTRRGRGNASGGIEIDGGSFETGRVHAWAGGRGDEVGWAGSVSFSDSEGISTAAASRGAVEPDGYENVSLDGRLDWSASESLRVDGFVRWIEADLELDDFAFGFGPVDDPNFVQTSRDLVLGGRVDWDVEGWSGRVTVSDTEIDLHSDNPDAAFFLGSDLDAAIRELDWQNRVDLSERATLAGGVELRHERATVTSRSVTGESGFDEDVRVVGAYLRGRAAWGDRTTVTVGARHEDHELFGGETTFQVTGSVDAGAGLRLHGSAGTAFRAPSLNDLYFPFFGNPELGPEESLGFDLGIEGRWEDPDLRLDVTWFRNDVDGLIQFSGVTFRAENLGEVESRGVEIGGGWVASDSVRVKGSYTFTDAEEVATGRALIRRPRHRGDVGVEIRPHPRLDLFGEVLFVGERDDFGPAGRVALDAYALWNAAAEFELRPGWSLIGRFHNLLDEQYQEVFGFGTRGRSAWGGLRLRFGGEG